MITSLLWGKNGELWDIDRIADYSMSGLIKTYISKIEYDIKKDFKAIGDGIADDTDAFLTAIAKIPRTDAVLRIPEGKYIINKQLLIRKNISIIGEGKDKTILYFPNSLTQLFGEQKDEKTGNSLYTDRNALIYYNISTNLNKVSDVINTIEKGDNELAVSDIKNISIDKTYLLVIQDDTDMALVSALNISDDPIREGLKNFKCVIPLYVRSINGDNIMFSPSIPINIPESSSIIIYDMVNKISNVEISNLMIAFPHTLYEGHHIEKGYNALAFQNGYNILVDNLRIQNVDLGIKFDKCYNSTINNVELMVSRRRKKSVYPSGINNMIQSPNGHHGIMLVESACNLITNFNIKTTFIHDLSVSNGSCLNAFTNGRGINLTMDHHCNLPFHNIFSNINLGIGSDPFMSSGVGTLYGPRSGSYETFWNLRSRNKFITPDQKEYTSSFGTFGTYCTFVGCDIDVANRTICPTYHIENTGEKTYPVDIVDSIKIFLNI